VLAEPEEVAASAEPADPNNHAQANSPVDTEEAAARPVLEAAAHPVPVAELWKAHYS
jgi:hypothetical protein